MPIRGINIRTYVLIAIVLIFSMTLACYTSYKAGQISANNKLNNLEIREYQFDIDQDSIYLYDRNREVGSVPYGNPLSPLDSLILKDNQ